MLGIGLGGIIGFWMAIQKMMHPAWNVLDEHGPLIVFAAVLIVAGVQLLALGLLGEMSVRHYHQAVPHASYSVERVLRAKNEQSMMAD